MKRLKNERGRERKGDRERERESDPFDVLYNTSQSQLKGFVKNA